MINEPRWVELNFEVPADYRRDFYINTGGSQHKLEVRGNKMALGHIGFAGDNESAVLDWIQESIESVRKEFGK